MRIIALRLSAALNRDSNQPRPLNPVAPGSDLHSPSLHFLFRFFPSPTSATFPVSLTANVQRTWDFQGRLLIILGLSHDADKDEKTMRSRPDPFQHQTMMEGDVLSLHKLILYFWISSILV